MPIWLIVVLISVILSAFGIWLWSFRYKKKDEHGSVVHINHRPRNRPRPPADPAHGVGVREPVVRPRPSLSGQNANTRAEEQTGDVHISSVDHRIPTPE